MSNNYQISVNQLAVFPGLTEAGKRRIIAQQLVPNTLKVSWYQMPKSCFRRSIQKNGDLQPIYNGIKTLLDRQPSSKHQVQDRKVSIEALERFLSIQLPKIFLDVKFTIIKPKTKNIIISDVEVKVAPDVIVSGQLNGKNVIGAVKFHISKNDPFDLNESKRVASTIHRYLVNEFQGDGFNILPELCCCFDIFSGRIINAKQADITTYEEVESICREIKNYYEAVA